MRNKLSDALSQQQASENTANPSNPNVNPNNTNANSSNQAAGGNVPPIRLAPARLSGLKRTQALNWGNQHTIPTGRPGITLQVQGGLIIPIIDASSDAIVTQMPTISSMVRNAIIEAGVDGLLVAPTPASAINAYGTIDELVDAKVGNRLETNTPLQQVAITISAGQVNGTVTMRTHPTATTSNLFDSGVTPLKLTLEVVVDKSIELNLIYDAPDADVHTQTQLWACLAWATQPTNVKNILKIAVSNKKVIEAAFSALERGELKVVPTIMMVEEGLDLLEVMNAVVPSALLLAVANSENYTKETSRGATSARGRSVNNAVIASRLLPDNLQALREVYAGGVLYAAVYDPASLARFNSLTPSITRGYDIGFTIGESQDGTPLPGRGNANWQYYNI